MIRNITVFDEEGLRLAEDQQSNRGMPFGSSDLLVTGPRLEVPS